MLGIRLGRKQILKSSIHPSSLLSHLTNYNYIFSQVAAAKRIDDVELEGENSVPIERFGLFSRFPFLTQRQQTMTHLISHRHQFLVGGCTKTLFLPRRDH